MFGFPKNTVSVFNEREKGENWGSLCKVALKCTYKSATHAENPYMKEQTDSVFVGVEEQGAELGELVGRAAKLEKRLVVFQILVQMRQTRGKLF